MYSAPPPPAPDTAADAVADARGGVGNDIGEGSRRTTTRRRCTAGSGMMGCARLGSCCAVPACTSLRAVPSINLLNINDYLRKKVVHRSQVGLVNIG